MRVTSALLGNACEEDAFAQFNTAQVGIYRVAGHNGMQKVIVV